MSWRQCRWCGVLCGGMSQKRTEGRLSRRCFGHAPACVTSALARTRRHLARRSSSKTQQHAVTSSADSASSVAEMFDSSPVSSRDEDEPSIGPGAPPLFSSTTAGCTLSSSWSNVKKGQQGKGRNGTIEVTLSGEAACDDPAFYSRRRHHRHHRTRRGSKGDHFRVTDDALRYPISAGTLEVMWCETVERLNYCIVTVVSCYQKKCPPLGCLTDHYRFVSVTNLIKRDV